MNKRPEITAQTRKNLLDAFWQIYCEKRIEKITVQEITAKAGYNRGTFYQYFTDVYDVLEQIEASVLPNIEKHQNAGISMDFHAALRHLIYVYSQNKKYFAVLLGKKGDPVFQQKIKNVYKAFAQLLFPPIAADDFISQCTWEYAISAILGAMTYCFTREENPDIEKMVQLLWHLLNNGVITSFQPDTFDES